MIDLSACCTTIDGRLIVSHEIGRVLESHRLVSIPAFVANGLPQDLHETSSIIERQNQESTNLAGDLDSPPCLRQMEWG